MKNLLFSLIIFVSLCVTPINYSFAQDIKYIPLEPLPGMTEGAEITPTNYFIAAYWMILGLAIAGSILMIIVGGVEYTLTWASDSKKTDAKNRIENAIIGLILALTSYLILNTINPKLVILELPSSTASGQK